MARAYPVQSAIVARRRHRALRGGTGPEARQIARWVRDSMAPIVAGIS